METDEVMMEERREIYDRLRGLESKMTDSCARYDAIIEQNRELITLLKNALRYGFWIIVILIASLIYGALGAKGFNAVTRPLSAAGEIVANG